MRERFTTWWNTPVPPRKRGWVFFSLFVTAVTNHLRDQRAIEMQRRIEVLESEVKSSQHRRNHP